jgi:hypothetical protein
MAGLLFRVGKRLLISKRRQSVRGTVIFAFTHLLLFIGIVFAIELVLLLLGANDIYVPIAGRIMGLVR